MSFAARIQKRDYPQHECPETLERNGDVRIGMHANGEGWLFNTCLIPTTCGCSITGNGTLQHPLLIEPCEKHVLEMYDIPVEVLDRG